MEIEDKEKNKIEPIKQIQDYTILTKLIGEGNFGKVSLSYDKEKRLSVTKVIKNSLVGDNNKKANFIKECRCLSSMKHKNVVKLYYCTKNHTNFYIMMEYANRGDLKSYLKSYKNKYGFFENLNEEKIQFLLRQIIEGVFYIHKQNIVHRDIKLDNIFLHDINESKFFNLENTYSYNSFFELDENISIKIGDLGLSKFVDKSVASTFCGTPRNMAPEIFNKGETYNNKVDLWSLGTITYELLFNKPPFVGFSIPDIAKNIKTGKYTLPKKVKISKEILTFINGLLQFNPEKRLNWEEIFNHPFIVKNTEEFNYINLEQLDEIPMVDAKNKDNFLWVMYKDIMRDSQNKEDLDKISITIVTEKEEKINEKEDQKMKEQVNYNNINIKEDDKQDNIEEYDNENGIFENITDWDDTNYCRIKVFDSKFEICEDFMLN